MDSMSFPKGHYYVIICKAGDVALRIQENDHSKFEKSRVIQTPPNPNDNGQVWMVDKVGLGEDHYEIVNCMSGLVFDEESKEVRLKHGKQGKDQLFMLEQAPIQAFHKYYWIKCSSKGSKALKMEGILRVDDLNPQDESFLFRFEPVNNYTLQNSAIIINNLSGKALDVPGATFEFKKGKTNLIQWEKSGRWNQRWHFEKHGKGVLIRSALTGCCVDIAGENKKPGGHVIQWEKTGGSNQQWFAEPCGNNLFKFRSCFEPSLFLSIKKQDVNDGGQLETACDENPSMYWRIEGPHP
jgi:hypothetical protein